MGRPVILSNSHILVGLDEHGTVHDFYYPYVGLENLSSSRNLNHKIGIWTDSKFSWLDDGSWEISLDFEDRSLISKLKAENAKLSVRLEFQDFVDSNFPVFGRLIKITNLSDSPREIRLFMHQAFQISRSGRSDTALYVPDGPYILDYKGWSSLLAYLEDEHGRAFDQFAVGNCGIEGKEGTFKDAEDGELSGSLVEHGGVDSVMRLPLNIEAQGSASARYWIAAADSQVEAEKYSRAFKGGGIDERLAATRQTWNDWLAIGGDKLSGIDDKYKTMAFKSLMIVKSHSDRHGGVIASCDSSIYNYGRDYYNYVWPRDGAHAMLPLIELGYKEEPRRFFLFCADTIHPDGYMMHKYQPDRAIGSTWHPLLHKNHPELPIQEDETATVIYAAHKYLDTSNDEDFIRQLYSRLIAPGADFMSRFIDDKTSLPHASYDLWEQKFATFTYTVFITLAGLEAAAKIADRLHKTEDASRWRSAAQRIRNGLSAIVDDNGSYVKSILLRPDGNIETDHTVDAATFYGAFLSAQADQATLTATVRLTEEKLLNSTPIGGLPRYEHDDYFLADKTKLGNPWIITTLWLAQYYIKEERRQQAVELIDWVLKRVGESGMLAEQADPQTGIGIGVCPLVWSHSTFLETVLMLSKQNLQ
ncbi:MAG TPA: glycoside hydrolase family 15 protein [Candidatus Saccharimonadales bacterium]|nr:glycoside hydrolase family 15 protein [Candidatus Saccharimonadales bacterium]